MLLSGENLSVFSNALPKIFGILNITPDSMSDGGLYMESKRALQHARDLISDGADVIDVGAESTRPDAKPVSEIEEWCRLSDILGEVITIAHEAGVEVSIDTRNHSTAAKAVELGVDYINDVCGLKDDNMVAVIRDSRCRAIVMHSLTVPAQRSVVLPDETAIVPFLVRWAVRKIDALEAQGLASNRLIFDPGLGFGKRRAHCYEIVRNVNVLKSALGVELLVGHSRKTFLGPERRAEDRGVESLALTIASPVMFANYIRVHDVALHKRAFSQILQLQSTFVG